MKTVGIRPTVEEREKAWERGSIMMTTDPQMYWITSSKYPKALNFQRTAAILINRVLYFRIPSHTVLIPDILHLCSTLLMFPVNISVRQAMKWKCHIMTSLPAAACCHINFALSIKVVWHISIKILYNTNFFHKHILYMYSHFHKYLDRVTIVIIFKKNIALTVEEL